MIPSAVYLKSGISLKNGIVIAVSMIVLVVSLPLIELLSITNLSALINNRQSNSSTTSSIYLYSGPVYPGDLYDFGNCTFWVSMRRSEVGKPIPNNWGNAATWAARAQLIGYNVDHSPSQYSIMQTPYVDNGLGHVAFVESVDPNGVWYISEMNVVGFDEVDHKAMLPSSASSYNFIH